MKKIKFLLVLCLFIIIIQYNVNASIDVYVWSWSYSEAELEQCVEVLDKIEPDSHMKGVFRSIIMDKAMRSSATADKRVAYSAKTALTVLMSRSSKTDAEIATAKILISVLESVSNGAYVDCVIRSEVIGDKYVNQWAVQYYYAQFYERIRSGDVDYSCNLIGCFSGRLLEDYFELLNELKANKNLNNPDYRILVYMMYLNGTCCGDYVLSVNDMVYQSNLLADFRELLEGSSGSERKTLKKIIKQIEAGEMIAPPSMAESY